MCFRAVARQYLTSKRARRIRPAQPSRSALGFGLEPIGDPTTVLCSNSQPCAAAQGAFFFGGLFTDPIDTKSLDAGH